MKIKNKNSELSEEIRSLIKDRNKLRKMYQRNGDFYVKNEKNRISDLIRKKIKLLRNENLENKLSKLRPDDNTLWRFTKCLTKGQDYDIPPLHGPNGIVYSDRDKADVLAEIFERNHLLT